MHPIFSSHPTRCETSWKALVGRCGEASETAAPSTSPLSTKLKKHIHFLLGVVKLRRQLAAARKEAFRQFYAATRDQMAEAMTPAQIAEGQKRAADWQAAFEKRQPNYGLVAPRQRIP